jgi:fructose-bisphosphate aldolase, class I
VSAQRTASKGEDLAKIEELLGPVAAGLLRHECKGIPSSSIVAPAPDHVDRCFAASDRHPQVLVSLQRLHATGRLANTGYLSILPVDQGIEHSAAASFAPNPAYLDPENIVRLAVEGGCNAVASTLGVLGAVSRRWAHKMPFIVKITNY